MSTPDPRGIATVSMMAMPADANWLGDIFGGWLMSHADIAGAVLAYRRAGGKVVTVSVDDFTFIEPVFIGDVVTFFCDVEKVGTSSICITIDMFAERQGSDEGLLKVAQAEITYVHIDEHRKPKSIKRL